MDLTSTFRVDVRPDRAWAMITDLGAARHRLPGAEPGALTVRIGRVTTRYEGGARFVERDDDAHHAVIRAEGADAHGPGGAVATIDLRLCPQGSGTEVTVRTGLVLSGRVAQLGRGVVADAGSRLVARFAERMEADAADQRATGQIATDQRAAEPFATPGESPPVPPPPEAAGPGEPAPADGRADLRRGVDLRRATPVLTALLGLLLGWLLGRQYPPDRQYPPGQAGRA